jgi:beta-galactosidase/beta-glucuronidase
MKTVRRSLLTLLGFLVIVSGTFDMVSAQVSQPDDEWTAASSPLMSRWAKDVTPETAHTKYPRPQMKRDRWKNLNGLWQYAVTDRSASRPDTFDGRILVPYPIESALSGVKDRVSPEEKLWYRCTFELSGEWTDRRILLHFGAVDWETTVWVNGERVGMHQGGYDSFTFDISEHLRAGGHQEIVLSVWDPTDSGSQPRGKQVKDPGGIWYTPTTGIWQTVWLEPVPAAHIADLELVPDIDREELRITAETRGTNTNYTIRAVALAGDERVGGAEGPLGETLAVPVSNPNLWSPESPFLYDLRVELRRSGEILDTVQSYFGMRKISIGPDANGTTRLLLNNQPLFQYGLLDQGFWPGGLYTAPTDEALRYDIEMTKKLGFNMARKHVKVEPARWYYWADKLGLLVWQDMPNGGVHVGRGEGEIERAPASARQFEKELRALVDTHFNHPSIVMWIPFNEGWGQYDTRRLTRWLERRDPTRLVNSASGWNDLEVGDVADIHRYPGPGAPHAETNRVSVLGEFGGLGLPIPEHTWQAEENWGYESFETSEALTDAYSDLLEQLRPLIDNPGLAGAVYTQTTDVEIEVNGLMTYDRARVKMDTARVESLNRELYEMINK